MTRGAVKSRGQREGRIVLLWNICCSGHLFMSIELHVNLLFRCVCEAPVTCSHFLPALWCVILFTVLCTVWVPRSRCSWSRVVPWPLERNVALRKRLPVETPSIPNTGKTSTQLCSNTIDTCGLNSYILGDLGQFLNTSFFSWEAYGSRDWWAGPLAAVAKSWQTASVRIFTYLQFGNWIWLRYERD